MEHRGIRYYGAKKRMIELEWFFYDDEGTGKHGPYASKEECEAAIEKYIKDKKHE